MLMGDASTENTKGELLFNIIVTILGACVNAIIFANVTSLVTQIAAASAAHQAKMDAVDRAMLQLDLNKATALRIRAYFNYQWVRSRDNAGDNFISSLPYALRTRTSYQVHQAKIRQCVLFESSERAFVAALSTALLPEVYLPYQFVLSAGMVSHAMFFIARGHFQLIQRASAVKRPCPVALARHGIPPAGSQLRQSSPKGQRFALPGRRSPTKRRVSAISQLTVMQTSADGARP